MQLQANADTLAIASSFRQSSRHLDLMFVEQSDFRLELQRESVTRRLLSVFASGQVAEYELAYELHYVLHGNGKAVPRTIQILRDYQDDPKQVLAKSLELELIMSELRQRAVQQVVAYLPRHYEAVLNQVP
jgi:LPS-assembly lipoprotein